MDEIIVRPMLLAELPGMVRVFHDDWIDSESTLTATFNYDNEGILIAIDPNGAIVGAIAGCIINEDVGFIGYFVVKQELRGKGVGRVLLDRSLKHLGERNIGLNAIANVIGIYPKRGFNTSSFSGVIYRGNFSRKGTSIFSDLHKAFEATGTTVQSYTHDYWSKLLKYDVTIHKVERERFIRQWMSPAVTKTYIALGNDNIVGYGCVQILETNTYYIGPVFSDDPVIAKMIIYNLAQHIPDGSALTMEVPTTNHRSIAIAGSFGLAPSGLYTRLYTKEEIKIPIEKVFVLTTGAMGLI